MRTEESVRDFQCGNFCRVMGGKVRLKELVNPIRAGSMLVFDHSWIPSAWPRAWEKW